MWNSKRKNCEKIGSKRVIWFFVSFLNKTGHIGLPWLVCNYCILSVDTLWCKWMKLPYHIHLCNVNDVQIRKRKQNSDPHIFYHGNYHNKVCSICLREFSFLYMMHGILSATNQKYMLNVNIVCADIGISLYNIYFISPVSTVNLWCVFLKHFICVKWCGINQH